MGTGSVIGRRGLNAALSLVSSPYLEAGDEVVLDDVSDLILGPGGQGEPQQPQRGHSIGHVSPRIPVIGQQVKYSLLIGL